MTSGIQLGQNVRAGAAAWQETALRAAVGALLVDGDVLAAVPPGWRLGYAPQVARETIHATLVERGLRHLLDSGHLNGYAPDGGIFTLSSPTGRTLHILSSEAKYQQDLGNAIERWFKNYLASRVVSPDIASFTFAAGAGAAPGCVMRRVLYWALLDYACQHPGEDVRDFNRHYMQGPSIYADCDGFDTAAIIAAIKPILVARVQTAPFH